MAGDKDSRTYIRVHDGMPDHPKIEPLSDAAFRLLIKVWCWSGHYLTDGLIPSTTWLKRGTPKSRAELIAAGLAELLADGAVQMHDYTDHQRTADEVKSLKEARREAGRKGGNAKASAVANAKQDAKQTSSKNVAYTETETEVLTNVSTLGARIPRSTGKGTRIPEPFTVDEAMKDWAIERGMQPQWVMAQTERFVNYWLAAAGQKGVKTDWRATWRNWLLKAQDDAPAYSTPTAARKHAPLEVPSHIDPDDGPAYAAWLREATQ